MAARMKDDGREFNTSGNVGMELALYDYAQKTGDWGVFDQYADGAYDSSADYWKVTREENGSYKMEYDGTDDVNLVDENGNRLASYKYAGGSRTGFIAETLGLGKEQVNTLMGQGAGWTYGQNGWGNDEKTDGVVRFGTELSQQMAFPLDEAQQIFVQDFLGTEYNGKTFNYNGVRVSYNPVSETELREQLQGITYPENIAQEMINALTSDKNSGLSLPNGKIYMPGNLAKDNPLLTHEVFHQFQYMDIGSQYAFQQLVNEQIDFYKYKKEPSNGSNPYGYIDPNNYLKEIKTMEGQAQFIEDQARLYKERGVINEFNADILFNSGLNKSKAIGAARKRSKK